MRKKIIAGNWKLYNNIRESLELVTLLKRENLDFESPEIIVCPVFTALSSVYEVISESRIKLGAQNLYWEEKGAFTGEVSGPLLKDVGCEYVIIGHSERRQFFHETDETVNKKTKAALKAELIPIVCCGESLQERQNNQTNQVLEKQIRGAFQGISVEQMESIVIAYEPIWAIGTGKVATPQEAEDAHQYIRKVLQNMFDQETAQNICILYGGSVKPANAREILSQANVDGALVGGASLEANGFAQIVKSALETRV